MSSLFAGLFAGAHAAPGPVDVVTPLATASPRMRFHEGQIADNQPKIEPALPSIEGAPSAWIVSQWQHREYLGAPDLKPAGGGRWIASTPDGGQRLTVQRARDGHWVYELFENGGILTEGGGSNLFLATQAAPGATFDHDIALDVLARVTEATVRYDTPDARASGAAFAMAFVGLGLLDTDPSSGLQQFVFMQVDLTGSSPPLGAPGYICAMNGGVAHVSLFAPAVGPDILPFAPERHERALHVNLTVALRTMIANRFPCAGHGEVWSLAERNPANWRLVGLYAGLEVENEDHRMAAHTHASQGQARLGLEFDQLSVTMQRH